MIVGDNLAEIRFDLIRLSLVCIFGADCFGKIPEGVHLLRRIHGHVGLANLVAGDRVVGILFEYGFIGINGRRVVLLDHRALRERVVEKNGGLLFLLVEVVLGHAIGLFEFVQGLQASLRGLASLGRLFLGGGVRLAFRLRQVAIGEGAGVIGLVTNRRLGLFSEGEEFVGVFDNFRPILKLAVGVVIERVDVDEERGVWIFRDKIIEELNLLGRILFRSGRLVGVVLGHGVLLFPRTGVLTSGCLTERV